MSGFAVQHATLIDGTGAAPVPDSTVIVDGDRVAYAGPARDAPPALLRDREIVPAAGRWVLPGLVNAHEHLSMKGLLTTPGLERAYYDLYRQPASYQLLRAAR